MESYSLFLLQHRWIRWSLNLAFMTLLGLINTGQSYLSCTAYGSAANFQFWPTLALGVSDWYLWAALTPVIIWLSRRFPFYPESWGKSLIMHVGCNLLFSFIIFMFTILILRWVSPVAQEKSLSFCIRGRANAYMIRYFWFCW